MLALIKQSAVGLPCLAIMHIVCREKTGNMISLCWQYVVIMTTVCYLILAVGTIIFPLLFFVSFLQGSKQYDWQNTICFLLLPNTKQKSVHEH